MRLMLSPPKKTIRHFAASFRCPRSRYRSRWAGYLSPEDSPNLALPVARLQTMLFALWSAAGKDGSARSKPACAGIRPPVAFSQPSQLHFGLPATLVGVCRASSPIPAFPATCCLIHPGVRGFLPGFCRAATGFELVQTDYRQNSAKYSLADEAHRGRVSPLRASYLRRFSHRFHWSDFPKYGRSHPRSTYPPPDLRRLPVETSSRIALPERLR